MCTALGTCTIYGPCTPTVLCTTSRTVHITHPYGILGGTTGGITKTRTDTRTATAAVIFTALAAEGTLRTGAWPQTAITTPTAATPLCNGTAGATVTPAVQGAGMRPGAATAQNPVGGTLPVQLRATRANVWASTVLPEKGLLPNRPKGPNGTAVAQRPVKLTKSAAQQQSDVPFCPKKPSGHQLRTIIGVASARTGLPQSAAHKTGGQCPAPHLRQKAKASAAGAAKGYIKIFGWLV